MAGLLAIYCSMHAVRQMSADMTGSCMGIRPVARAVVCMTGGKDSVPDGTVAGVAITLLITSDLVIPKDISSAAACILQDYIRTWALEGVAVEWDPYCRKH